jgi:hypothetical protein
MVIVKGDESYEAGAAGTEEMFEEMGKFNQELADAGIMLAGDGLHPTSKAKRVKFSGRTPSVIDGPFSEAKEMIAGYWLWQVDSIDQAVEWLKRAPFQDTEVDIRPLFEAEDFGDEYTPEQRERDDRIRAQIESREKQEG